MRRRARSLVGGGIVALGVLGVGTAVIAQTMTGAVSHDAPDAASVRSVSDTVVAAPQPQRVVRATPLKRKPRPVVPAVKQQHSQKALVRSAEKVAAARTAPRTATSSFRIGTLNILGSQHTRGKKGRYGPGTTRAGISAGLIQSRGIDLVGLQEVQNDQLGVLTQRLAGYTIWPQQSLGRNSQRLQIAWRTSRFMPVETGSVSYVFASQRIPLPWVRLRDRSTGAEFFVITTHNSAGGLEGQRDAATSVEISLIKALHARGLPVFITGDMNEHEEFFCRASVEAGMVAANGGSGAAGCQLPPRPLRVDWIMGTQAGVQFSGYVQDAASLARASDHYLLHANVTVQSSVAAQ